MTELVAIVAIIAVVAIGILLDRAARRREERDAAAARYRLIRELENH